MKNKTSQPKENIGDESYSVEPDNEEDSYAKELSIEPTTAVDEQIKPVDSPRPKTFHSKNFTDGITEKKSSQQEPPLKMKISHAEASGVIISAVMLIYSLAESDKPLFFLSTALLTFLLRPLIGALFGKHNRAVQNALHSFSVVLFIGALIMLIL